MTKLSELCRIGGFELFRDAEIRSPCFLNVEMPDRLVFVESEAFAELANRSPSVAGVLADTAMAGFGWREELGIALAPNPGRAFLDLHNYLAGHTEFYGALRKSVVDATARVHGRGHVDEIGVVIGPECRIDAGAVVLEGSHLGCRVHVMSGAVIGGSGFQTMNAGDRMLDFVHAGAVEIDDGTIVMANAVIARAVFKQSTRVGEHCRIGNGAFVSHNCQIGAHSLVGHGAVVSGNTDVGSGVVIGPGATCINNTSIGDGAKVTMGAVVTRSVRAGQRVSGNFALDHEVFVRGLRRDREM